MAVSKRTIGEPAELNPTSPGRPGNVPGAPPSLTNISADSELAFDTPSPARYLQESLIQSLEAAPATSVDITRWSTRRSLAFIIAASALLWLAIAAGIASLAGG